MSKRTLLFFWKRRNLRALTITRFSTISTRTVPLNTKRSKVAKRGEQPKFGDVLFSSFSTLCSPRRDNGVRSILLFHTLEEFILAASLLLSSALLDSSTSDCNGSET